MLPEGFRRKLMRRARFESFEQRLALSANPISDFAIEHHTSVLSPIGMDGLPSLGHHVSEIAPAVPELHVRDGVQGDFILEKVSAIGGSEIEQQLNDVHEITGVNSVRNNYGFTGSNQTVAIIDSGIAYDHYNLGGGFGANNRVVGGWDFAENDADPYDDAPSGFHGTHVAGIVGSDHSTYRGVAEEVDLVALRVFNDQGDGVFSWVEQALDWVHDNRNAFENDITTVNLSLGSTWNSDSIPSWASLEDEFAQLEADGIFISVSAGNSFVSYNTRGLSYPAASPYVVPVASITNGGIFSSFSQRHDRALAAPGSSIGSTVPDYVFGADGVPNDFGIASGTSMAAPYVAGASVLVRQAMEFVGTQNITQDMIYDHLRDTSDVFFDSATNANYRSINVSQAIDQLMPDDDFGSSSNTAHSLGTLNDGSTFSGLIGQVNDFDYFTFTAGATGALTLGTTATHDLAINASGDGATFANGELTMDVVSGQSYTVSLGTSDGIGYYDVSAALEAAATDLGTVDFEEYNDQSFEGSESYDFIATRTGIFTVETMFNGGNGNIDLQLLDGNGNEIGSSSNGVNAERIDANVLGGQSYTVVVSGTNADVDVRLANLVAADNGTFTVFGTDGDDYLISDARDLSISINGIVYLADAGGPIADAVLSVDLGAGNDTAVLHGSSGNEVAVVSRGNTTASGSTNNGSLAVTVLDAENVQLNGHGGSDSITFVGTDGDASPAQVLELPDRGAGFFLDPKEALRVFEQDVPGLGEDAALRRSVEESLIEFGFESSNRLADGRLCTVQPGGGARETTLARDGDEDFEFGEVHRGIPQSRWRDRLGNLERSLWRRWVPGRPDCPDRLHERYII